MVNETMKPILPHRAAAELAAGRKGHFLPGVLAPHALCVGSSLAPSTPACGLAAPRFVPVLAALLLALPGLRAADNVPVPPERLTEHREARDGQVIFLRNEAVQPTPAQARTRGKSPRPATLLLSNPADLAQLAWSNDVSVARRFLIAHASTFGEKQPQQNLAAVSAQRDELGMTHLRFQQTWQGVSVIGSEVMVHLTPDQQISSASGKVARHAGGDAVPQFNRSQARSLAEALWRAEFGACDPQGPEPVLRFLSPGLLDGAPQDTRLQLVWELDLSGTSMKSNRGAWRLGENPA